jgi:alginate O-acetyltransferase complex protein AlgJ
MARGKLGRTSAMVFIAKGAGWPIHAQRLFLGFVAFCLVAPLVQTLYPIFGKSIVAPVEERRAADPFPPLHLLTGANGDFAAELNKWFDDRVGFRDLLIRSKNQIDYSLFNTSKKVFIGANGWLFDRHQFDSIADVGAAGLTTLEASYLALARQLNDKGIHLIVIGYPQKVALYPEMAPPDMPLQPGGNNYEQFRNFLASRSELTFIDAEAIMKVLKVGSAELLYAKGDIHATQFAQRAVVKEIVARIAQIEGRPNIHWDEALTLTHLHWRGGIERNLLAVLFPPDNEIPLFEGGYSVGEPEPDGQWTVTDPGFADRADPGIGRPFDFEYRSRPELCPQRLPGTMLFGNSFSDYYWALGLQRYFCFIRRARNPISRFQAFYETMPAETKYFIFQYYEPWLVLDTPPLK